MKRTLILASVTALLVTAASLGTAEAAVNAYIKYEGVEGEATSMDHKGWIDLKSFSSPIHKPGSGTGATRRRGDVKMEDITVAKEVDKSSPKLAEAICNGKVFPKVEIYVTASNADTGRETYYTYELTNARVTSYSVDASNGDAVPTEELALNFEEIKVNYDKAGPMSKKKGNIEYNWKVEEGEK